MNLLPDLTRKNVSVSVTFFQRSARKRCDYYFVYSLSVIFPVLLQYGVNELMGQFPSTVLPQDMLKLAEGKVWRIRAEGDQLLHEIDKNIQ